MKGICENNKKEKQKFDTNTKMERGMKWSKKKVRKQLW